MIIGYPGETAHDVHASAEFLEQHERVIERVSLNRLQVITGTALHRRLRQQARSPPALQDRSRRQPHGPRGPPL